MPARKVYRKGQERCATSLHETLKQRCFIVHRLDLAPSLNARTIRLSSTPHVTLPLYTACAIAIGNNKDDGHLWMGGSQAHLVSISCCAIRLGDICHPSLQARINDRLIMLTSIA